MENNDKNIEELIYREEVYHKMLSEKNWLPATMNNLSDAVFKAIENKN